MADDDVYICPAGERLAYHYTNEENGLVLRRYWTNACQSCAIKHNCTTGKERRITRWEHEHILEAVQRRLDDVLATGSSVPSHEIGETDIRAFAASYARAIDSVDLVVFSAPQLSLIEMAQVAGLIEGRQARIPLLVVTSPQVKGDADRMGLTARIEAAGGTVLAGMCFYQSYARELAEANGWRRLATNSAKLVNIIGGYGYQPVLMSMPACIDAACNGGRI